MNPRLSNRSLCKGFACQFQVHRCRVLWAELVQELDQAVAFAVGDSVLCSRSSNRYRAFVLGGKSQGLALTEDDFRDSSLGWSGLGKACGDSSFLSCGASKSESLKGGCTNESERHPLYACACGVEA